MSYIRPNITIQDTLDPHESAAKWVKESFRPIAFNNVQELTFIRYITTEGKVRNGGFCIYVDPQYRFIKLKNLKNGSTWCVQNDKTAQIYYRGGRDTVEPIPEYIASPFSIASPISIDPFEQIFNSVFNITGEYDDYILSSCIKNIATKHNLSVKDIYDHMKENGCKPSKIDNGTVRIWRKIRLVERNAAHHSV